MADHTTSYDTTTPKDSEGVSSGASTLRNLKRDIRERLTEEHEWNTLVTEGEADQDGTHKKVTLNNSVSVSSGVANTGILYSKDVSGKAELHYMDENNRSVKLTSGGSADNGFRYSAGNVPSGYHIPFPEGIDEDNCIVVSIMYYNSSIACWEALTVTDIDSSGVQVDATKISLPYRMVTTGG